MEVQVGSYYEDDALGARRDIHVKLTSEDGAKLVDGWEHLSHSDQYTKLRAYADIYVLKYAASRGFRPQESVVVDIESIYRKDLA